MFFGGSSYVQIMGCGYIIHYTSIQHRRCYDYNIMVEWVEFGYEYAVLSAGGSIEPGQLQPIERCFYTVLR